MCLEGQAWIRSENRQERKEMLSVTDACEEKGLSSRHHVSALERLRGPSSFHRRMCSLMHAAVLSVCLSHLLIPDASGGVTAATTATAAREQHGEERESGVKATARQDASDEPEQSTGVREGDERN